MSLQIVVRSGKDADAVEAMLERFYPGWDVRVETLKGARSVDKALDRLLDVVGKGFTIILLGREDKGLAEQLAPHLPYTAVVHVVPKARVRNARLEQLAQEVMRARARLRATTWWNSSLESYMFTVKPCPGCKPVVGGDLEPSYEVFIGLGYTHKLLSRLVGFSIGRNPLIVRTRGSVHEVYTGPELAARLDFRDEGLKPVVLEVRHHSDYSVDVEALLKANQAVLDAFEKLSLDYLKGLGDFDTIIVPWSGGKDSTAALLLAAKAYGVKRIVAVYTDTGTEFPQTHEYVEKTAEKLGVRVYRAYAGVDRELLEKRKPMPSHDNRWCTGLKIAATEKAILELAEGRTLVILGDRDAESPRRAVRPPTRRMGEIVFAAPLRFWSAAHIQLYILRNGLPLNPLYMYGFYRIGCYMCPSLRSWELYVITNTRIYWTLTGKQIFRRFIAVRAAGLKPRGKSEIATYRSILGLNLCCDACDARGGCPTA